MFNVDQITDKLAKLPDSLLQQYAQMHKNDPYIVSLAVAESNRRKNARAMAQTNAAIGQGQPGKVVDQQIAQMTQGLGGIAPQGAAYADGGIVAFAGGGTYETPYDRMNRLNREEEAANAPTADMPYSEGFTLPSTERQEALRTRAGNIPLATQMNDAVARARFKQMNGAPLTADELTALAAAKAPKTQPPTQVSVPPTTTGENYGNEGRRTSMAGIAPTAKPPVTSKSGVADLLPTASATSAAAAAPATNDLAALFQRLQKDSGMEGYAAKRDEAIKGLGEEMKSNAAAAQKEYEEGVTKRGDIYAKQAARLDQREGDLAGMDKKYLGLALLMGGAGLMANRNAGEGIAIGAKQYAAGMEKLQAAKDKIAESRDKLDLLRTEYDMMTDKERRQLSKEARTAGLEAKKLVYEAGEKDFGHKREDVKTMFNMIGQQFIHRETNASHERAQQIAASARGAGAGTAAERVNLQRLTAMQKNLQQQLKELPALPRNKAQRDKINDQLAQVNATLAGAAGLGTIEETALTGSGNGQRIIDFSTIR